MTRSRSRITGSLVLSGLAAVAFDRCFQPLSWVAPHATSRSSPSLYRHDLRQLSSKIALLARGGDDDVDVAALRTYAEGLEVPADYTGPKYEGPASVNDAFIADLLSLYKGDVGVLPMKYAYLMSLDVLDLLKSEKTLQRVSVPEGSKISVYGDIHGQLFDFVHALEEVSGLPSPENPILFNGDFVDRGVWSVEVLMMLFAFKLQHPAAVHFNRGNHETEMTNYQYGFSGEVEVKYEAKLMPLLSELFRSLPLATVLESQVFVSHAGLPGPENRIWEEWFAKAPDEAAGVLLRNTQVTLDEIEKTDRNVEPNPMDNPLVIDMLWSDPKGANGYGPSGRVPMVYTYGPDVAMNFLEANGLKYMIRSHETKSTGHQETLRNVYTVFSAPNYIDKAGNLAAVAVLTNTGGDLTPEFKQFKHQPHPAIESGAYMPGKPLAPK
eukprot:TRINITY_DN2197_c0_g1_i1.p1 TRINITY_DN2197_c0_g1~~TRINITY_DN2197_c0_g1_i1.p1  ORF type:complete len:438 (-),score=100.01 TRINITY_DN2197_c0_g1_i1:459-1772(-)